MLITIAQLHDKPLIEKIAIYSLEASLYQASVEIEGNEYFLAGADGKLLRSFSILELQKQLSGLNYNAMVLRHQSAFDEMVGLPDTVPGQNFLEVPLKDNQLY